MENPEIEPRNRLRNRKICRLLFDRVAKAINSMEEVCVCVCVQTITFYTKIDSKLMKGLSVRSVTITFRKKA